MKQLLLLLAVLALSLAAAGPVLAQEDHECDHLGDTVASLRTCVEHAIQHGDISQAGVGTSLLGKLAEAEAAVVRGQSATAAKIVGAFVREVLAQAGKGIDADHAGHLLTHAQAVLNTLSTP